jgi:antitoxin (DNA-binding transcriptional repressor) of toxin-antitoxin stability system
MASFGKALCERIWGIMNGLTPSLKVRLKEVGKKTAQYTPFAIKLSISEARKRLPELVRRVRKDAGAKVEITVHDEVVAELRAALPEPEPGAAAKRLRAIMRRLPKRRGPKTHVSSRVKRYLYGAVRTKS